MLRPSYSPEIPAGFSIYEFLAKEPSPKLLILPRRKSVGDPPSAREQESSFYMQNAQEERSKTERKGVRALAST